MVTMSDVARAVGVTPVTVSNVVNGRKGVSPDVRRRVQAELERSGYRLNVSARNLRVGRTGVIGLAVPELDSTYFGQLGTLITAAAAAKGYRVVVEETKARASRELAAIQLSEALDYDGLILSAARLPDADEPLTQLRRIPTVLLGERDLPQELDHIELANIDGTREATELLIARGCRKLAFVGRAPRDDAVFGGRREGFYAALSVAGLEAVTSVPLSTPDMTGGRRSAHQLCDDGPDVDGIVALTDAVAIGVIRGLADRGVRGPHDVKVVGFDDVPEASFMTPSLSTVAPDHVWTARRAVERLVARLEGGDHISGTEVAPFAIVERESTSV